MFASYNCDNNTLFTSRAGAINISGRSPKACFSGRSDVPVPGRSSKLVISGFRRAYVSVILPPKAGRYKIFVIDVKYLMYSYNIYSVYKFIYEYKVIKYARK